MVNRTLDQQVRALLGESIPTGKMDTDTMFSDEEIEDFLELGHNDVNEAAYHGWVEKAANYAKLVDVNEGNAARRMGDLLSHALRMVDRYVGYIPTPSRGRAQMGQIVRENNLYG